MKDLNNQEFRQQIAEDDNAVILDVRTHAELEEEGMIKGAQHHDIHQPQKFMNALESMDKTKSYYIYCRSGGRSGQACQIMDQMGFANTYNLETGFMNWDGESVAYS
jgi:rhodanese-related sulfurtransferase